MHRLLWAYVPEIAITYREMGGDVSLDRRHRGRTIFNVATFAYALVFLTSCSGRRNQQVSASAANDLGKIERGLEGAQITRIDLLYFREDLESIAAVNPEGLEQQFSFRLTIGLTGTQQLETSLRNAIKSTKVYELKSGVEVRFGLEAYRSDGSKADSVFFNSNCRQGFVNELPTEFEGPLCSWVKSKFSGVM